MMIIGEITDRSILAKSEYLNPMAIALLMAITTREVALACRMEKQSAKNKAGTMAKPPPTPKNPVKNPTPVALRLLARMLGRVVMYSRVLLNLEIMVNATTSVRMAKPLRSRESGILLARRLPTNEPTNPKRPKLRPPLRRTCPAVYWLISPMGVPRPTMINETVVACVALKENP